MDRCYDCTSFQVDSTNEFIYLFIAVGVYFFVRVLSKAVSQEHTFGLMDNSAEKFTSTVNGAANYNLVSSCPYASSELLFGPTDSLRKTPAHTPVSCRVREGSKPTIWHSHPLHTVITLWLWVQTICPKNQSCSKHNQAIIGLLAFVGKLTNLQICL